MYDVNYQLSQLQLPFNVLCSIHHIYTSNYDIAVNDSNFQQYVRIITFLLITN